MNGMMRYIEQMRRTNPWFLNIKGLFFISILIFLFPKELLWSGQDFIHLDRPESLLEESWKTGIDLGIKEGLTWGKDLVFTYGPLGYLMTGITKHGSITLLNFYYLFALANAAYFIWFLLNKAGSILEFVFLLLMLTLDGQFLFTMDIMTLFFFYVFHAFLWYREKKMVCVINVMAISILSFFMKANAGIIVNVFFIILLAVSYIIRAFSRPLHLILLFFHITSIIIFSYVLHVDIIRYVINSIEIIKGYSDAMYIPARLNLLVYAIIMLFLFIWPYIRHLSLLLKSMQDQVLAMLTILFMFLLFKQGFVRADGHVNTFITGAPFVVWVTFRLSANYRIKNDFYPNAIIIGLLSFIAYEGSKVELVKRGIGYRYFMRSSKKIPMGYEEACRLPESFNQEVKGSSVDVVGYLASHVYYNDLNYKPRPIFQSYSAYTSNLLKINAQKYEGCCGPDYVLFHFGSIDNRHPFWDDARMYFPLMTNYRIIDTITNLPLGVEFLVFKKDAIKYQSKEHILLDTIIQINTDVKIPASDKLLYLEIECEETILGKIKMFLYQPSEVRISLTDAFGSSDCHRIILPVMEAGVPINHKVKNKEDAYHFFHSKGKDGIALSSFMIKGHKMFLKEEIRARFIEYDIARTGEIYNHK